MNIAFVAKKLESGGTEVSLINLLKKLACRKDYKITLFVLEKKGMYVKEVPNNIEIVEIFDEKAAECFEKINIKSNKLSEIIYMVYMKILTKIDYKLFKKSILKRAKKIDNLFDIAIDFHGYGYIGTDYIIKHIKAKRKCIFIHDEKIDWISTSEKYFDKFDDYLCVSNSCKKILEKNYPYTIGKVSICRNIIDKQKVIDLSKIKCENIFDKTKINFLTIGRLEYQKGYDLLLNIAEQLNNKNINFKWYIIGGGTLKDEIEQEIERKSLKNKIVLCGIQKNPYNYLKQCDFYVQTSRHEGYGIAIAEARILKKIVISTNIECIQEQITNDENGVLCSFDVGDFLKKIMNLIENKEYREKLQNKVENQVFEENNDMMEFLDRTGEEKMKKVGIITITQENNYGNRLQNYAVQKVIEMQNIEVETLINGKRENRIIDFIKTSIKRLLYSEKNKRDIKRRQMFRKFDKNIKFTKFYISNDKIENKKLSDFEAFIAGSDQIWNLNYPENNIVNFLGFTDKKKISFAASFGSSTFPENYDKRINNWLNDIEYLSVRENAGKQIIEKLTGRKDAEVLIDPTMLLSSEEWDKVAKRPEHLKTDKYILNYFLGELSEERKSEINRIAKENGCEVINILDKESPFYQTGPSEFLYLEKNAFLICTDSFHSSVFAILYNRPFIVFKREDSTVNMNSRIETLIKKFNLKNREFIGEITERNLKHDYTEVYKILEEERKKSIAFLKKALEL